MNIFHKVTLQSLKKNKVRTIVTIIGIMLSAAMICAVTTFVSSIYNYALETAIYSDGSWHGSETNTSYKSYETIAASDQVESTIYMQQLGYAMAEGCTNAYKPYIYVLGASDGAENMLPVHITAGVYPTRADEILLPNHLASNGGVKHQLGDTITLGLGNRMLDGYPMNQNNPIYVYENGEEVMTGETLEVHESRTYTVVGFYDRFPTVIEGYSAPGYTAITLADQNPSGDFQYEIYFKMKKPQDVFSFMENNGLSGHTNNSVLVYSGASQYDGLSSMITGLAAIVIGLIMFCSVSLIYNAFSISVSERTKQFGLLSSVGATKKQLRKMVLFEALSVSAIGIPLGILVGIGGIGVTLLLIGNQFATLFGYPIALTIHVSPLSIVIAVALVLITVLISAWIPSKRATRISAVEAIRQNRDIHTKAKASKTSKLTYKLFGLPGVLASKHYKRSKKSYRATIISLFMSIVLFVSASSFTDYLMDSVSVGFAAYNYDLRVWCSDEDFTEISKEELLAQLKSDKNVTDAAYVVESSELVTIDKQSLTKEALQNLASAGSDVAMSEDHASMFAPFLFVDDTAFKGLLETYHLDEAEYMNPQKPMALVVNSTVTFNSAEEKYVSTSILNSDRCSLSFSRLKNFDGYSFLEEVAGENGETVYRYQKADDSGEFMDVSMEEAFDTVSVETGKRIERPFFVDSYSDLVLVYPYSLRMVFSPDENTVWTNVFYMTSDNHSESYTAVDETLAENGLAAVGLYDYAAEVEGTRNLVTIIQVFSYGFIVLISLIAAANVFNTISTNISLRRREFAMLKSVGMSAKGFNRMMNFECLLYGSRALLYGLPVAAGVTYLIHLAVTSGYVTDFRLPWASMGIAVLSVFLVVFVTMMYSMGKVKKDNPIDALKNENI